MLDQFFASHAVLPVASHIVLHDSLQAASLPLMGHESSNLPLMGHESSLMGHEVSLMGHELSLT